MIQFAQVAGEDQIQKLRSLLAEFMAENRILAAKFDMTTIPTFKNIDDEIATLPGIFAPQHGRFLVALDGESVVGCVALKPISETVGELKRMYVTPAYRSQRIGWRLVELVIEAAREIGYTRLILDSHISATKAHGIYRASGFKDVPTPEDFPEFLKGEVVFMEMDLKTSS